MPSSLAESTGFIYLTSPPKLGAADKRHSAARRLVEVINDCHTQSVAMVLENCDSDLHKMMHRFKELMPRNPKLVKVSLFYCWM